MIKKIGLALLVSVASLSHAAIDMSLVKRAVPQALNHFNSGNKLLAHLKNERVVLGVTAAVLASGLLYNSLQKSQTTGKKVKRAVRDLAVASTGALAVTMAVAFGKKVNAEYNGLVAAKAGSALTRVVNQSGTLARDYSKRAYSSVYNNGASALSWAKSKLPPLPQRSK